MWTRPGYNYVLYTEDAKGAAVFCWWRPKWEDGQDRFDGLRAFECTIFRNETSMLSSELILEACSAVLTWKWAVNTAWPDGLITGVNSQATQHRRSKRSRPGECFRRAGFVDFEHKAGRGDVWLRLEHLPPRSARASRCGVRWR
jgi:hypothetical protein